MTDVDEGLVDQLLALQREVFEVELCMANAEAHFYNDMAKYRRRLEVLQRRIEAIQPALYWVRLFELCHTPCWRFRVDE